MVGGEKGEGKRERGRRHEEGERQELGRQEAGGGREEVRGEGGICGW